MVFDPPPISRVVDGIGHPFLWATADVFGQQARTNGTNDAARALPSRSRTVHYNLIVVMNMLNLFRNLLPPCFGKQVVGYVRQ